MVCSLAKFLRGVEHFPSHLSVLGFFPGVKKVGEQLCPATKVWAISELERDLESKTPCNFQMK